MSNWSTQRLEVNRRVRSVLVAYCIDLGKLSIHVYPDRVSIRGNLAKLPGGLGGLTVDVVNQMFAEIKKIPQVKKIRTSLEDWSQEGDSWVKTVGGKDRRKQKWAAGDSGQFFQGRQGFGGIYDLDTTVEPPPRVETLPNETPPLRFPPRRVAPPTSSSS